MLPGDANKIPMYDVSFLQGVHFINQTQNPMSKPITNVTLKFPCKEDWNGMDISSGERICSRCQHKVIDFTNMSDEEYQLQLKQAQHACGRFKKSQLSSEFLKYAAATIIAVSAVGTGCDVEPDAVQTTPIIELEDETVEFVTMGIVIPPLLDSDSVTVSNFVPVIVPDESEKENTNN